MAKHLSNIIKSDPFEKTGFSPFSLQEVESKKETPEHLKNKADEDIIDELKHSEQALSGEKPQTAEISEEELIAKEKEKIGGIISKIEQEAYEEGFSAGEAAGREMGLKKLDTIENILLNLVHNVNHLKKQILKESEEDMLTIALAVARQIVRKEVMENPEVIIKNIQTAIKKIGQTEKVLIRLHPDDYEVISQDAEDLLGPMKQNVRLRFETDAELMPGDCVVEGEERMVDARLKNQLDVFEAEFYKGTT